MLGRLVRRRQQRLGRAVEFMLAVFSVWLEDRGDMPLADDSEEYRREICEAFGMEYHNILRAKQGPGRV